MTHENFVRGRVRAPAIEAIFVGALAGTVAWFGGAGVSAPADGPVGVLRPPIDRRTPAEVRTATFSLG